MAELADAYALGAYGAILESSTLSWPTKNIMKVTIENKKGLSKDLKVFVDKKTIDTYVEEKYEEIKKQVVLKGFRPGKVPKEVLKRQFGKSIYGEVLDKVLKKTVQRR